MIHAYVTARPASRRRIGGLGVEHTHSSMSAVVPHISKNAAKRAAKRAAREAMKSRKRGGRCAPFVFFNPRGTVLEWSGFLVLTLMRRGLGLAGGWGCRAPLPTDLLPSVDKHARDCRRFKVLLQYDGEGFHGWLPQHPPGKEPLRTVGGTVEVAFRMLPFMSRTLAFTKTGV